MHATFALAALLPALALSAPAELAALPKAPVTCDKPDAPSITFLHPSIPDVSDCMKAIQAIKQGETHTQGSTVEFKTCSVTYTSLSDIDGEELKDAATEAVVAIIQACKSHQGTYSASGPDISVKKPTVTEDD